MGFEREAHQQAAAFACAQFGGDVARTAQGDAHFAAAFFDFRFRNGVGRVVRDGRAHDGSVGSVESRGGGVVHFGGRKYVRALHSGGRRQGRTAADERHVAAAGGQCARNGVAHLARRVVRYEPHGVDGFDRGACRYDEASTLQALFFFGIFSAEQLADEGGDVGRFGHAALARQSAGQLAFGGLDDPHAPFGQTAQVLLRRGMGVHVEVHGRRHDDRAAGREIGRQQQVVGDAAGHFGQRIGRGGGYQVTVGPLAERDVRIPRSVFRVEEFHENRVFREGGHRQGRDELLGQRRHDDAHFGARALQ